MSVHVGEFHTEVVPAPTAPGSQPIEADVIAAAIEASRRTAWLAARVAAEDFDD